MAASLSSLKNEVFSREHRRQHHADYIRGMNALDRHHKFINDYVQFYGGSASGARPHPVKTDEDVLRESYRFIRTKEDDADASWEQRLARRYYEKLFREYCVADMALYKLSKIGLRWRTEKEVIAGKGQFSCGAKGCGETTGLHSYEVNFAYTEAGDDKQALVKLRVCPKHAYRLNYRKERELGRKRRREERELRRQRRKADGPVSPPASGSDDSDAGGETGSGQQGERSHGGMVAKAERGPRGGGSSDLEAQKESSFDAYLEGMFP